MADSTASQPAQVDQDQSCITCGYNLRGLSPNGRCPECATPIELSLRGDLLKFADPEWLDRLRLGAALKLWSVAFAILAFGSSFLLAFFRANPSLAMTCFFFLKLINDAVRLWSSFAISSQEPRSSLTESSASLRRVIRVCACVAVLGTLVQWMPAPAAGRGIAEALGVLLSSVVVFVMYGELRLMKVYAQRVPDPRIVKSASILMWVVPLTFGVVFTFRLGLMLFSALGWTMPGLVPGPATNPQAPASFSLLSLLWGLGLCVFALAALALFLWYVIFLIQCKDAFAQAAEASRTYAMQGAGSFNEPEREPAE